MMTSDTGDSGSEPIAIVGMACRWPGGVESPSSLWDLLKENTSPRIPVPSSRFNAEAYYSADHHKPGSLYTKEGYFLEGNVHDFDPSFFGIGANEASSMDPQQRKLLEVTYECFESAGITLDAISGTRTGCFIGNFSYDFLQMTTSNLDSIDGYSSTGTGATILSNRITHVFDLKGPSLTVDTACSSSLYAMHLACNSLLMEDCTAALVGGTNLILSIQQQLMTAKLGVLSPTGTCHSFDERADGYARAEGVGVIMLKKLSAARRDGDPIRAIIRGTAFNANGRAGSITTPSVHGQETVMKSAYTRAGLSVTTTQYVEAHATGTPVGDPIEVEAIGRVFSLGRTRQQPLPIGSVKSNLGHSEAASGMASIMKTVLAMEKGVIPATVGVTTLNPQINFDKAKVQVVTENMPWPGLPSEVRTASINSSGYGGANAHVVIQSYPPMHSPTSQTACAQRPYLLVFSAKRTESLQVSAERCFSRASSYNLADLSYTLGARRSMYQHRAFAIRSFDSNGNSPDLVYSSAKTEGVPEVLFVFTGQGAQWPQMGKDLGCIDPSFDDYIHRLDLILKGLEDSPKWSIADTLAEPAEVSKIKDVERSQTVCTAIQIAVVALLNKWGISPAAVVGHSSGEIATAYAAGFVTPAEAITIAYYRGKSATKHRHSGAMLAVALSESEVQHYLSPNCEVVVACINSPQSVTLSGQKESIETLATILNDDGIFVRNLQTDNNAYHSPFMTTVGNEYIEYLQRSLNPSKRISEATWERKQLSKTAKMYSSVTTELVTDSEIALSYWKKNLELPVRFDKAVHNGLQENPRISQVLEVGPHAVLKGPVEQIVAKGHVRKDVQYIPTILRGKEAAFTLLKAAGSLFLSGYPIDTEAVNATPGYQPKTVPDLPTYAWIYDREYWKEPNTSKQLRLKPTFQARHDLLGSSISSASSVHVMTWRNELRVSDLPWLEHHKLNSDIVLPGACYIAMAFEALMQRAYEKTGEQPLAISLVGVVFKKLLVIPPSDSIEISFHVGSLLVNPKQRYEDRYLLSCCSFQAGWVENFTATGILHYDRSETFSRLQIDEKPLKLRGQSRMWYDLLETRGIAFGPCFRTLLDIKSCPGKHQAVARSALNSTTNIHPNQSKYLIHPTNIDATMQMLALGAYAFSVENLTSGLVPVEAERIVLDLSQCNSPQESMTVKTFSSLTGRSAVGSAELSYGGKNAPALLIYNAKCRPVQDTLANSSERMPYMRAILKPYIRQLSADKSRQLFPTGASALNEDMDLERVLRSKVEIERLTAVAVLLSTDQDGRCRHVATGSETKQFTTWLEAQSVSIRQGMLQHCNELINQSTPELESELQRLYEATQAHVEAQFVTSVFRNLSSLLSGQTRILELAKTGDFLGRMYSEGQGCRAANLQLRNIVDLIAHENPNMDILEVGAGTGSTTAVVLQALAGTKELRRYKSFTFTDISSAFVSAARERFSDYREIQYGVLDINSAPAAQGYTNTYDLIIAANTLHVTKSIAHSLGTIRSMLKPGGKLVLLETLSDTTSNLIGSFCFGLLPDWWLGSAEGRVWSPFLSATQWDNFLSGAGFSGLDHLLSDYPGPAGTTGVLVSTYLGDPGSENDGKSHDELAQRAAIKQIVVYRRGNLFSHDLGVSLCERLHRSGEAKPGLRALDDPNGFVNGAQIVLVAETGAPLLDDIQEDEWAGLKELIRHGTALLWVKTGDPFGGSCPDYGISSGLIRAMRIEHPTISIKILDLQTLGDDFNQLADSISESLPYIFGDDSVEGEHEFAYDDGMLYISRICEDEHLNALFRKRFSTSQDTEKMKVRDVEDFELEIENHGLLDGISFRSKKLPQDLAWDEVEIEAKAWSSGMKGILAMMGKFDANFYSMEVAGVVRRVGHGVQDLHEGDDVVAVSCMKFDKYSRCKRSHCEKFSGHSYTDMATMPVLFPTVIKAMIHQAQLQPGEKVLIHSAAGGLGLAAIQLAKSLDADIFATVGTEEKRQLLVEHHGLCADHIFLRQERFRDQLMEKTQGAGVDVVLNTLAGEQLQDSLDCVGRFGRFVELGFKDIYDKGVLPLQPFDKNISLFSTNLSNIYDFQPDHYNQLLREMLKMLYAGTIAPIEEVKVFDISELGDAIRYFLNPRHTGKMVVSYENPKSLLEVSRTPEPLRLNSDATYLIVGGLGGLGRSIALWMLSCGAKNLMFLSRSGGKRPEEQQTVADLIAAGGNISTVTGDVSRLSDVSRVVSTASPPIKGVIHCAMVLRDSLFIDMPLEYLQQTLQPKVQGMKVLDEATRDSELEFFIQMSSIASLCGTATQSNYCAANAFEDAFARYRCHAGRTAVSLNVGLVGEVGYVAENPAVEDALLRNGIHLIYEYELHHLLQSAILHNTEAKKNQFDRFSNCSLISGLEADRLQELWSRGYGGGSLWQKDRRFSLIIAAAERRGNKNAQHDFRSNAAETVSARALQCTTPEGKREIILQALRQRISGLLLIDEALIQPDASPLSYGVDSMIGAELRHWLYAELQNDIPFSYLLSPTTTINDLVERSMENLR